jgi:hypothetical protein
VLEQDLDAAPVGRDLAPTSQLPSTAKIVAQKLAKRRTAAT